MGGIHPVLLGGILVVGVIGGVIGGGLEGVAVVKILAVRIAFGRILERGFGKRRGGGDGRSVRKIGWPRDR